ncbi:hypothetical protein O181_000233 [Austropuccinia psidii MF-1]|uniref:Reverse transcriptase Ty1/copia-type domain-containing protein n=1 Tax=Austropuccinia psidii MF-1 TaxID=1389203 RepID=A0A9Q3B871_9BASI|nr:hypothetical protein [Austropuccinia psidii MF-1]
MCLTVYSNAWKQFDKIFSPTGHFNSLHTLVAFSASNNLEFCQTDVKSAFLNTLLVETLHSITQGHQLHKQKYFLQLMTCPPRIVWMTKKLAFKGRFSSMHTQPLCFSECGGTAVWLYINVDEIAIFSRDVPHFNSKIEREFDVKDVGPADFLLWSLLELYGIGNCRNVFDCLVPNENKILETEEESMAFRALGVNYCGVVGSINYFNIPTCETINALATRLLKPLCDKPLNASTHQYR